MNPVNGLVISTGTIIRFFVVLIAIALLYYMFDVMLVIVAAIVIASAMEPAIRKLKKYKIPRIASVLVLYVIMAGILSGILLFFMPVVVNDAVEFLNNVPKTISLESVWSPVRDLGVNISSTSIAGHSISISDFIKGLQSLIVGTGAGALQTVTFIFGGVLGLILIIVLSFYLAVQEGGVENFLKLITPVKKHDYITDLWQRSQRKIGLWLQGQILLGVIVGVLVYLVLTIVGIKHALLLAILAGALEIIPVFGPIISAVPAVLIAFTDSGLTQGFILIGLYLIIHQFENHLFYPLVVKKIVGISPIVVILALVIGAKLAGILGALLAVPLAAAFMEYISDVEKGRKVTIVP
jgi:predicted PurR-regulated permease PerM